jgi:hypothetical protein
VNDESAGSLCALDLANAYEQLRRAATEMRRDTSLRGLGILICKGVAVWMQACTAASSTAQRAPPSTSDVQLLPAAHRDVVDVLATMALMTITTDEVRT